MTIEIFGTRSIIQHMITSFIGDGYVLVRSWSKKKYFWFGKETFYAELEVVTGQVDKSKQFMDTIKDAVCPIDLSGEYIFDGKTTVDYRYSGCSQECSDLINQFPNFIEKEDEPLSPKQLKAELDHALSMEDYEYASKLRDKIKELDGHL